MVAIPGLAVEEFKSCELSEETRRKGLVIHTIGQYSLAYARCYEGFQLSAGSSAIDEVIESDVFDMDLVSVDEAARRKGLGTRVITRVFTEACNRGFSLVRFEAASPRIISIMEKLLLARSVSDARYVVTPATAISPNGVRRTTQEILEDPNYLHTAEARDFLYGLPLDENQMNFHEYSDRIEAVVHVQA